MLRPSSLRCWTTQAMPAITCETSVAPGRPEAGRAGDRARVVRGADVGDRVVAPAQRLQLLVRRHAEDPRQPGQRTLSRGGNHGREAVDDRKPARDVAAEALDRCL